MTGRLVHPLGATVKAAIIDDLVRRLTQIEGDFVRKASSRSAEDFDRGAAERAAAGASLVAIVEALHMMEAPSRPLDRLLKALIQLEEGGTKAAMFEKKHAAHRAPDQTPLLVLKGLVAAIADSLREVEPRTSAIAADAWAAGVLRSTGHSAFSDTSPRKVRNWRTNFGGPHADPSDAAKAYKAVAAYIRGNVRGVTITREDLAEAIKCQAGALPEIPSS